MIQPVERHVLIVIGFLVALTFYLTSSSSSSTFQSDSIPKSTHQTDEIYVQFDEDKVATIVEPRNLNHLIPLIVHFLQIVPLSWTFVVWCSNDNIEALKLSNAMKREMEIGRLQLRLIPSHLVLNNGEVFNAFIADEWFWNQFTAEWILFFESDSILCSQSEDSVDNWLGFDWVGERGGLSIRKRSSLLHILKKYKREVGMSEDKWFIDKLMKEGKQVLLQQSSQNKFSIDTTSNSKQTPLGIHKTNSSYWNKQNFKWMEEWCSEIRIFSGVPEN